MDILAIITFVLIVALFTTLIILIRTVAYLSGYLKKLQDEINELRSVRHSISYIKEEIRDLCEVHCDDVRKIQAEVLARDILKEPDPEADITKLMNSTW